MANILAPFRDELIAQGVVRKPRVAGAAPPMWLEPELGTPAPGESRSKNAVEIGPTAVLGAFLTGGFTQDTFWGQHMRKVIVDVRYRVSNASIVQDLDLLIIRAVVDKRDWVMGGQQIVESRQWRALSRLGSDEQGFEYVMAIAFEYQIPAP